MQKEINFSTKLVKFSNSLAVYSAVLNNDMEQLTILKASGADLQAPANMPLRHAIGKYNLELVKYLCGNGVNFNIPKNTPINRAIEIGAEDIVSYLLGLGAKPSPYIWYINKGE